MVVIFRFNKHRFMQHKISVLLSLIIILFVVVHFFEISYHNNDGSCTQETIDVVYTWVNGTDEQFIDNLNFFLDKKSESVDSSKQRFDDKNELKFSLRSLEKFAPWINHVFIVTNGQIPYWLNLDYEKVTLITHTEIFSDVINLPSFSSPAIESNLHKIPGLSKRFIYFNDDIFLGSPIYLEDFLSANKGFLIYLAWPVPMCAPNCPWMYVADGQCDKSCYNIECQLDGGDCLNREEGEEKVETYPSTEIEEDILQYENDKQEAEKMNHEKIKSSLLQYRNNSVLVVNNASSNRSKILSGNKKYFNNLMISNEIIKTNLTNVVKSHNERIILKNKLKRSKFKKYNKLFKMIFSDNNSSLLVDKLQPVYNIDAYSASLQHTNRILNNKYGFKTRKVPAHSPIMVDTDIMMELRRTFEKEFDVTERNRIRSADDVQFSFSYYYFLISEKINRDMEDIFDEFDTDKSSTWSDREIRTLLTKLYELPLSYAIVDHFDAILLNCSESGNFPEVVTPPYERYIDSRLPTISKELVTKCSSLTNILNQRFGRISKYKYEVVNNAENKFVTFKMLNSNISDVVSHLDDIRSNPKKFICLNDNLDDSKTTENDLVKAILYDFYVSLFPHPSKFELPDGYRNKFMYTDHLNSWKSYHLKIKLFVYFIVAVMLYLTFFNLCKKKLCQFVNKIFC